jgi:hypothetical protein
MSAANVAREAMDAYALIEKDRIGRRPGCDQPTCLTGLRSPRNKQQMIKGEATNPF